MGLFNHRERTGLAAPAIAAGFGALAPTLGTIIPAIGASGFAAVATAAGSVAGSVAVAASFGGKYKTRVSIYIYILMSETKSRY